jgi:hypothetical protein
VITVPLLSPVGRIALGIAASLIVAWWSKALYDRGVTAERNRWQATIAKAQADADEQTRRDRVAVEEQNRADRATIAQLNAQVLALTAHPPAAPAPRIVRVCNDARASVPSAQADAGDIAGREASGSDLRGADDSGRGLLELRADILKFAAACQADNVAAMAGQAQWPR